MRIAVVGGGFGGVYAIKTLQRYCDATIVLFEPNKQFVFTPLLHEVATATLHVPAVTHSYKTIFLRPIKHICERVTHIDVHKKQLTAGKTYKFDYIIISPGATTRVPKQTVLTLKTIKDAITIRRCIEQNVHHAALQREKDPYAVIDELLHCVIVGGGPTGVELAAEMIDFLVYLLKKENLKYTPRVTLLERNATILANIDPRIQKIARTHLQKKGVTIIPHTRVASLTKTRITCTTKGKKQHHHAGCIIRTAGVVPHNVRSTTRKERGHFLVDKTLQLHNHTHAYAIGDAARLKTPVPKLAQVAVQQGICAAHNIVRRINGKPLRHFKFNNKGFLLSLGQRYAAGIVQGIFIKGLFAWFLWRTIYLTKFVGVRSKLRIATEYTRGLIKKW